jgi:hypothetical protein
MVKLELTLRCTLAICVCVTALLNAGCASLDARSTAQYASDPALRDCATWYEKLDVTVDAANVRDGGEARVAGFPHLRVNRFLASFRNAVNNDSLAATWLAAMLALDRDARNAEISNLPNEALSMLGSSKEELLRQKKRCSNTLANADKANVRAIAARAVVPDDYASAQRILGLYAITRIPFFSGVSGWQEGAQRAFQKPTHSDVKITHYTPPNTVSARPLIAARFANAPRDALGVPQMTSADWHALFDAYAPEVEVEISGDYDNIGALTWDQGSTPFVDRTKPVVYRRLSWTRIAENTHAQLNYSFWFSERPSSGALDLLAGKLDGIIFRVTLDQAGQPLIHDSIHSCGCYHLFFPTVQAKPKPAPESMMEWAFVPQQAPALLPSQRIVLRLQSRSHHLIGLSARAASDGVTYQWRNDQELRALQTANVNTKSVFASDGIIPGTERGERWLFWPMGIASPGSMRQWGRHATAFVGRRHFDDVDLLELRFLFGQQ